MVKGLVPGCAFPRVGERLTLDFVNTQVVEGGQMIELLPSDTALMRWAAEAGLPVAPSSLAAANGKALSPLVVDLRQALRTLLERHLDGAGVHRSSVRRVNEALAAPAAGGRLKRSASGWAWEPAPADVASVLRAIAEDFADLVTSDVLARVSRCANERCVLMFLDRSRAGRRRWCSMKVCGNRAKVAAYHRRARARAVRDGA